MLSLIHNSVLLSDLFVTTILQWKREEEKSQGRRQSPGIAPEEDKELDQLLDEIVELFDESDKAIDETKQKQEEEVKKAEEMQKRSVETFKEIKVQRGMVMNNMEQNREKLELVEQTLWLT